MAPKSAAKNGSKTQTERVNFNQTRYYEETPGPNNSGNTPGISIVPSGSSTSQNAKPGKQHPKTPPRSNTPSKINSELPPLSSNLSSQNASRSSSARQSHSTSSSEKSTQRGGLRQSEFKPIGPRNQNSTGSFQVPFYGGYISHMGQQPRMFSQMQNFRPIPFMPETPSRVWEHQPQHMMENSANFPYEHRNSVQRRFQVNSSPPPPPRPPPFPPSQNLRSQNEGPHHSEQFGNLEPQQDLHKIFSGLQEIFPKFDQVLLKISSAILISHLYTRGTSRTAKLGDLKAIKSMVSHHDKKRVRRIVEEGLKKAEEAYISGQDMATYGGQTISGTNYTIPETSPKEAEVAIQSLLTDPSRIQSNSELEPLRQKLSTTRIPGVKVDFPKELGDFLTPSAIHKLHLDALKDLETLVKTPSQFEAVPDIAFGLVQMTPETQHSAYAGRFGLPLPELTQILKGVSASRHLQPNEKNGKQSEDTANAIRFREITLTAKSSSSTLIDVRTYPDYPSRFAIMDDHGVTRATFDKMNPKKGAVKLLPGSEYSLTLMLDTRNGHHRSGERGLLQQLIFFTTITNEIPSQPGSNWKILENGKTGINVFAVRVSVALTSQADDYKFIMSSDASSFIPKHLSTLFDHRPQLHHADSPPFKPLFEARDLVGHVCPWINSLNKRNNENKIQSSPPAHVNQGMTQKLRQKTLQSSNSGSGDEEIQKQIKKYTRQLALEECAMEDQIRRYDMFNIRCRFAVFESSGLHYRTHTVFPKRHSDLDLAAPRKTYRGPHLETLYPEEDMTGCCPRRVLSVIEVPGLPEDRPSLVFGDTVHIRFADAENIEFTGYIIVNDSANCLVAMPKEFYACCIPNPRSFSEDTTIEKVTGLSGEKLKTLEFGLLHVRFGFDRTRMTRMHSALEAVKKCQKFHFLPPKYSVKEEIKNMEIAGLPSDEDFFEAVGGALPSIENEATDQIGPTVHDVRAKMRSLPRQGKKELNEEQKWAVASFLAKASTNCPFTIYGPPGTGKTVTLVECALQVLRCEPDSKILLCAPQGYSADLLASALGQSGVTKNEMIRLADPRHPPPQMKDDVLEKFSNLDYKMRAFTLPDPKIVADKRVVVMTCGAAGILRSGQYKKFHETEKLKAKKESDQKLVGLEFSHVLIDEAGQALIPEALSPLSLMQPEFGRALLCGDPKQLGPVVRSLHAASGDGLSVSLLETFIKYNASMAQTRKNSGSVPATATLVQNYRSHHTLLELPNKLFYNGALHAASKPEDVHPIQWSYLRENKASMATNGKEGLNDFFDLEPTEDLELEPLDPDDSEEEFPTTLFYGVRGQQMREGEAPSFFNPIEATQLVDLVENLLKEQQKLNNPPKISAKDIGVIATYRKQVQKIRLLLRARGLGEIRVGTVDDLQGQEERIIFISTVLSKPETLPTVSSNKEEDMHVGFWRNPRRFNVATTRAKSLLVVLGHPLVLLEDPSWRELMRYCKEKGTFNGAGQHEISHLLHSKTLQEARLSSKEIPGEEEFEDIAATVNRLAEISLLGANADSSTNNNESHLAYQSEVQWRVVM